MENKELFISVSESTNGTATNASQFDKNDLKDFYTKGVPHILKAVFFEPISGTYALFTDTSAKTYSNALVLIVSTAILYTLIPYLLLGEAREYVGFGGAIKIGVTTFIFMVIVSLVAFGVKSISGKPRFKNELLTGGLCGIPLTVLLVLLVVAKIIMGDSVSMASIAYNPQRLLSNGIFFFIILFYIVLMLINILQQSYKAGGTKDALAWYLSPIGIALSFYLTYKLGVAFLS